MFVVMKKDCVRLELRYIWCSGSATTTACGDDDDDD